MDDPRLRLAVARHRAFTEGIGEAVLGISDLSKARPCALAG